jgi:hypothetical protein
MSLHTLILLIKLRLWLNSFVMRRAFTHKQTDTSTPRILAFDFPKLFARRMVIILAILGMTLSSTVEVLLSANVGAVTSTVSAPKSLQNEITKNLYYYALNVCIGLAPLVDDSPGAF